MSSSPGRRGGEHQRLADLGSPVTYQPGELTRYSHSLSLHFVLNKLKIMKIDWGKLWNALNSAWPKKKKNVVLIWGIRIMGQSTDYQLVFCSHLRFCSHFRHQTSCCYEGRGPGDTDYCLVANHPFRNFLLIPRPDWSWALGLCLPSFIFILVQFFPSTWGSSALWKHGWL